MDLEVLFEDEHLIVVNKAPGLVVHPAPGHPDQTLVNALLAHCKDLSGVGGELRPGIVHRLDKDTSGVIVVSKTDTTHHALAKMFKDKTARRTYLAFVMPPPRSLQGRFSTLYGRHRVHRKKFSSKVQRGKTAVTFYRTLKRFGTIAAEMECRLETGRTHQIRVHFADHGSPVFGDLLYSRKPRVAQLAELFDALGRQALHAQRLELKHPITNEQMTFEAPLPEDLRSLAEGFEQLANLG